MTFRAHELMAMLAKEPDCQQYTMAMESAKFDLGDTANFNALAQLSKVDFLRAPVPLGLYQVGERMFLLARDDGDEVKVNIFYNRAPADNNWHWLDSCCIVAKDSKGEARACVFNGFNADGGQLRHPDLEKEEIGLFHAACTLTMAFEVFSCCNVTTIETQPPKFINAKRIAKGKVPFFSYRTLHITPDASEAPSGQDCGTHASPRLHLRRGHIRRLADRRVWVRSSLVGDKSKGIAAKDYKVIAARD